MICSAHNMYLCSKDECVRARGLKLNKIKMVEAVKEVANARFESLDEMIAAANAIVPHDVDRSIEEAQPFLLSQLDPTHTDPPADDVASAPSAEEGQSH